MDAKNNEVLCWLCVNICNDFKCLYNKNGQENENFFITVKYFDPMIFNYEGQGHHLIVMCLKCWQHINDFHNFRESVLLAQTKLLEVGKDENVLNSNECLTSGVVTTRIVCKKEDGYNVVLPETDNVDKSILSHSSYTPNAAAKELTTKDYSLSFPFAGTVSPCYAVDSNETIIGESSDDFAELYSMDADSTCDVEECAPITENSASVGSSHANQLAKVPIKTLSTIDPLSEQNVVDTDSSSDVELISVSRGNSNSLPRNKNSSLSPNRVSMFQRRYHLIKPQLNINQKKPTTRQNAKAVFVCQICRKRFSTKMTLQWHMHIKHKSQLPQEMDNTNLKLNSEESTHETGKIRTAKQSDNFIATWVPILNCQKCEVSCPSYTLLRIHHYQHHPNEAFYIECCKGKYFGRYSIEEHVKNSHFNEQKLMCKLCKMGFPLKDRLDIHMSEVHGNSSTLLDLKCDICKASCSTLSILEDHFQIKHPNKKCSYTCCRRTFSGAAMQEHERLHQFKASLENAFS